MKRVIALAVCFVCLAGPAFAGLSGKKALYVGGTVPGLTENKEGRLVTAGDAMTFTSDKRASASIPYANITELEYGQKAGRRVGVAVMISPLALFSKKRNHYLTIAYKDADGKEQAAVFELGKDIVRTTLKIVETRSGKDIKFQDDDARKSIGGGKSK